MKIQVRGARQRLLAFLLVLLLLVPALICSPASTQAQHCGLIETFNGTWKDATATARPETGATEDSDATTNAQHFYSADCTITLDADAQDGVCANSTGHTAAVPDAGEGATYIWTIQNGSITGGQGTRSITWDAGGTSPITIGVTVYDANGRECTNSVQVTVYAPCCTITLDTGAQDGVCANSTGHTAAVPDAGEGATYVWTIQNGSITGGQGTRSITWDAGGTSPVTIGVSVSDARGRECTDSVQVTVNALCCAITLDADAQDGVCANSTGHTATVPDAGEGATYVWTIQNGSITGGQGTSSITWDAGGTSPVTIGVSISDARGRECANSVQVTVYQQPGCTLTLDGDAADGAICASSTAGAHSASVTLYSGAIYTWTVTGGTLDSGQGTNSITWHSNTPGTADIQVEINNHGCYCTNSVQVTVYAPCCTITLDADAQDGVCANSTGHTATVPDAGEGATYVWTIQNGSIAGGQGTRSITWDAGGTSPITIGVTVYDANGRECTNSVQVTVYAPCCTITLDAGAQDGVCANSTGHTAAVPDAGEGATYVWTIQNGSIAGGQGTRSITWDAGGTSPVTIGVSVSDARGHECTNSIQVTVYAPCCTITLDADAQDGVCANSTGHTAAVPDAGEGATYVWTVQNGSITGGQGTRSIIWDAGGTSPVTIGVSVSDARGRECTNSVQVTVYAPDCTITLDVDAQDGVCANSTGHTAAVPDAGEGATYVWTIQNGSIAGGQGTRSIAWDAGGTSPVTIGVSVSDAHGCTCTSNVNVTVYAKPTATASVNPTSGNVPLTVNFTGSASGGTAPYSYSWAFGDGGTSNQQNPSHTYNSLGTYTAILIVTDAHGCQGTAQEIITVTKPQPVGGYLVHVNRVELLVPWLGLAALAATAVVAVVVRRRRA